MHFALAHKLELETIIGNHGNTLKPAVEIIWKELSPLHFSYFARSDLFVSSVDLERTAACCSGALERYET